MSNQPESSDSNGAKRDFSTGILEKKKSVDRLVVDESVNDDNSVVDTTEKLQKLKLGDTSHKANDTIKLDLGDKKSFDLYDVGNVVLVTDGKYIGRVGIIKKRKKYETFRIQDTTGRHFTTDEHYLYPAVQDGKPWVPSKPWETILEENKQRRRQKKEIGQATA